MGWAQWFGLLLIASGALGFVGVLAASVEWPTPAPRWTLFAAGFAAVMLVLLGINVGAEL